MSIKPPARGTTTIEVHMPPPLPGNRHTPAIEPLPRFDNSPLKPRNQREPDRIAVDVDLDAIIPAPPLTTSEIPNPVPTESIQRPLSNYRVVAVSRLPEADESGMRTFKGRRFVDLLNGEVLHVGRDADSGLYRAKLQSELTPSGPVLIQDPDSKRWFALDDFNSVNVPLTVNRLQQFRTPLDFSGAQADSDGVYRFEGKVYAVIEKHSYQVMHDADDSAPERKVWRIVNAKDPVADDSANVYRASRLGESRPITRNSDNVWVSALGGLSGGMRRQAQTRDNKAVLLQRYEPIHDAFKNLVASDTRYGELWSTARSLPEGSAIEAGALIALEVHILKHTRLQADYVQSLSDNREWLTLLKAGGLYKSELHDQQMKRVDYFNKLIAIMDRRIWPTLQTITLETCKKSLVHLNKKLKIMEERQVVMNQIRKASRSAGSELDELGREVPDVDQVNCSKFNMYMRLLSDDPNNPPEFGKRSALAIHLFVKDMKEVTGHSQPIALQLALDEIRTEKSRFAELSIASDAAQALYFREALTLIDSFELKIETRLNDIYDRFGSNHDLPSLDQEIDFDFVPRQAAIDAEPAAPRKMFRTRQNGTYRVLVGVKKTAADGSITVQVPDLFKPNDPPRQYEKRQGEWQPVQSAPPGTPTPQLISEANRLLGKVDEQLLRARAMEMRNDNPTNIREFLGAEAERLSELVKRLQTSDAIAVDARTTSIINRLKTAEDSLNNEGHVILVGMYKNKDVLDTLRLNYLLDHSQLNVIRTVERKQLGKGKGQSFLDVYSINDRSGNAPLWEAHFHYDAKDRPALEYTVKGAHMKTLLQSGQGSAFQQREEQAGRAHQRIWREYISPAVAQKLFDHTR